MKRKLLVVEDDFDTLHPLAELLRLEGYDVETSSDAEEALELARQRRPDLVITDIVLPGKSGLQLIRAVRGDNSICATPIVVITGCGAAVMVEAESAGADCCIEKPIHVEPLFEVIGRLLDESGVGELLKANEAQQDPQERLADELNRIVDQLRQTTSKDEIEDLLKELKERVFKLQSQKAAARKT